MRRNEEYINLKVDLIMAFLIKIPRNILDISFDYEEKTIVIQIVLTKDTYLDESFFHRIKNTLKEYSLKTNLVYVSKEKYNENVGGWIPSGYSWLKYNLYSKAEAL